MAVVKYLTCLLVIFADCRPGMSISIKFFEDKNSSGYFKEVTAATPDCNNVPPGSGIEGGSIETDTCIIVFNAKNCFEDAKSTKLLPGSHNIELPLYSMVSRSDLGNRFVDVLIGSYFLCNSTEGGPQLNVELTSREEGTAKFQNICGCRELPRSLLVVSRKLSADNHGNPFMKYTERNCKGEGALVPAGKTFLSDHLNQFIFTVGPSAGKVEKSEVIRSIGPVVNSLYYQNNCVKLKNTIYKFEFEDDLTNSESLFSLENMDSIKFRTRNNSTGKSSEEFKAKLEVVEGIEVDIGESLSKMNTVSVEGTVEIETQAGVPFLAGGNIKASLTGAYEQQGETSTSRKRVTSVQSKKLWQVKENVEVLPCTDTTVHGVVKMIRDKPLKYKVYGSVTGQITNGGKKMTAGMIRKSLSKDLKILEDVDGYTVAVVGDGVAKSNFGIDKRIIVKSEKIPGCKV